MTLAYLFGAIYLISGLKKLNNDTSKRTPFISIIVSMHNEEKNVKECLAALLNQVYPEEKMEIIIVNDRSTDKTADYLDELSQKHRQLYIITINDIQPAIAPKKLAIDTAIRKQAKGEIILLTDADGRPGPLWAQSMVSFFTKDTGMVLGYAPYLISPPYNSFLNRLCALEYFSHAAITLTTTARGYPLSCVGTNMAYRKEVFLQLDGFGKYKVYPSGDDDLFMQRVREETKWKIRYASIANAHVYNAPPESWKKFYHQRLRYASKGFFYPSGITITLTGYVLLNVLFLLLPVLVIFNIFYINPLLTCLLIKIVSEILFFLRTAKVIQDKRNLIFIPIFSLLHIPYVVYFTIASQFQSFEWAGIRKK